MDHVNNSQLPPPTYAIVKSIDDLQINVTTPELQPEQVADSMLKEASKSSLCGAAYMHKLAANNLLFAKNAAAIYKGYHAFCADRHQSHLENVSKAIINDPDADEFSLEMARYVIAILENRNPQDSKGKAFIKALLPSFKKTVLSEAPTKLYAEQDVRVPEMTGLHCAFPDLIKFNEVYYATFREGKNHVDADDRGVIRILRGEFDSHSSTWNWQNAGTLTSLEYHFRDPHFFVNGNKQLCMVFNGSVIDEKCQTSKMVPHVATLEENAWNTQKIDLESSHAKGEWIWRVTWNPHDNHGYGLAYNIDSSESGAKLSLVKTHDGVHFERVASVAYTGLSEMLNEATIRFKDDGTLVAFIRSQKHGLIGRASPKSHYKDWSFDVIPFRVGGPNFLFSQREEKMWAATRHLFLTPENIIDETTILASLRGKKLVPLLQLKSEGDASYPGMVLEDDGSLTVLYYTSNPDHKGATIRIVGLRG